MAYNVILVGFMGAGKSSVGRLLARRLGRCFVETDDMIIAREGCSIPTIFATHGEEYFRAAEAEAVRLLALKRGDVIHVVETAEGYLITPYDPKVAEQVEAGREFMKEYRDTFKVLAK